jgi:hypothetical protein
MALATTSLPVPVWPSTSVAMSFMRAYMLRR